MAKNGRAGNPNGMKWIRNEKRLAIYLRDQFCCAYCGKGLHNAKAGQCSLDHLIPRSEGGSNEATNLVTACLRCNVARSTTPWAKYATAGAKDRIRRNIRRTLNLALAKDILAGAVSKAEALR